MNTKTIAKDETIKTVEQASNENTPKEPGFMAKTGQKLKPYAKAGYAMAGVVLGVAGTLGYQEFKNRRESNAGMM